MNDDLSSLYLQAQIHSLSYEHAKAFEIIEQLLESTDRSHEILRFKGNVIEFKTHSELADESITKKQAHRQYKDAFDCYLESLE